MEQSRVKEENAVEVLDENNFNDKLTEATQ
jgi:hypothetical protein